MNRLFVFAFSLLICLEGSKLASCQEAPDDPFLECELRSLQRWLDCDKLERDLVWRMNNTDDDAEFALLNKSLEKCRMAARLSLRIAVSARREKTPEAVLKAIIGNDLEKHQKHFLKTHSFLGLEGEDISSARQSWADSKVLIPSQEWIEAQRSK